jgi:CHAT domain-containing protein/tetratricopeptide (TPR) repeat protein
LLAGTPALASVAVATPVRLVADAAALARAEALLQAGEYLASARLCQQVLRALPEGPAGDNDRARLLELRGEALRQAGSFEESAASLGEAIRIYARWAVPPVVPIARARQRLAWVRLQQQRGAEARTLLERAETDLASVPGRLLERAAVFDTRGDAAYFAGQFEDADEWYSRAIEEADGVPGGPHLAMALSLRNKADSSGRLGHAQAADDAGRRAFELATRLLPAGHPELAGYYNDAANIAWSRGDTPLARRYWEAARQLLASRPGPPHPGIGTIDSNLALLARDVGDLDDAIALQRRSIGLRRQLRASSRTLAMSYTELGRLYLQADRFADAAAAFGRALRLREASLPPEHPDLTRTRVDLARVALGRGDVTAAAAVLARIPVEARGPAVGSDFDRLITMSTEAELAWTTGALERAKAAYSAAADGYLHSFGAAHPNLALMRTRLAEVLLARGEFAAAARMAIDAESAVRDYVRMTMRNLSERLALSYAARRPESLDVLVSAAIATPGDAMTGATLTEVARSRSQVFDELVERRRPRGSVSAQEARLREALQSARSQWANLALRGAGNTPRLAAARAAVDAAERALGEENAEVRRARPRVEPSADGVRGNLPDRTALVSFVRYGRRSPLPPRPAGAAPAAPPVPVPSYVAIVTSRARTPVLIDLGDAASLDRLVATWRDEAARGLMKAGRTPRQAERAYRRAGEALRIRIWDPLVAHLDGATRVLIVPDGALQVVGVASLPVGTDRYLADGDVAFHYLTTERDVLQAPAEAPAGRSLLAVGGVDFGQTAEVPQPPNPAGTATTRAIRAPDLLRVPLGGAGCVGADEIEFPPLPATAQEARDIERMWRETGGTAVRLAGRGARERRVRELASQQRVLHFATHGFFLDSTCAPVAAGTRSVRKRIRPGGSTAPPAVVSSAPTAKPSRPVNPLALSGLAFANANGHAATTRGEDDGVLTAEEVATLDLHGVEWVVLSACDTGLGPIRAREGVLGLRRAFQVAGARTVIMSLWSVEDRTTRDWMRALYRSRLQGHRETIDSMRDANRAMLDARRAAGATTHPYYWAGFAAAGDWR